MGVTVSYKGNTIASMSSTGSKTLQTAGKYCEADIQLSYQSEPMPNCRKYTGTISQDIVGSGVSTGALLVNSPEVAAHYADPGFKCAVYFAPDPEAAYAIIQVTGYNVADREPYRQSSGSGDAMQYTYREGASLGTFYANYNTIAVSSSSDTASPGRIICNAQGDVFVVASGSTQYGIRKGSYVVEISW